jgi:16S rRNA (cytosine1402-N4)-methyltransferase
VKADGSYVDATYGRGGHSTALLARLGSGGSLLVVDRDPEAVASAGASSAATRGSGSSTRTFDPPPRAARRASACRASCSTSASPPRSSTIPRAGFQFPAGRAAGHADGSDERGERGAFLARADEREIGDVIAEYGEERFARRRSRARSSPARASAPVDTTARLADVVAARIPARTREPGKHPATRTFQALRIHVNRELGQLIDRALDGALECSRRRAARGHQLPFARGPHREALHAPARRAATRCTPGCRRAGGRAADAEARGRKLIRPASAEVAANPRARSAVLRVAEKVRAGRPPSRADAGRDCGLWVAVARGRLWPARSGPKHEARSCSSSSRSCRERDRLRSSGAGCSSSRARGATHGFVERVADASG